MTTLHRADITQFGRTFQSETWALDATQAKAQFSKKWKHAIQIKNIQNTGLTLSELSAKSACGNDKTDTP